MGRLYTLEVISSQYRPCYGLFLVHPTYIGLLTVIYTDLGENCSILIRYLERNGAPPCPPEANPAEWMLDIIKPPPTGSEGIDWHQVWRNSPEYQAVKDEMARLHSLSNTTPSPNDHASPDHTEFAAPFTTQLTQLLLRTSAHFWRSPAYVWAKLSLVGLSCLYLGLSFSPATLTLQGMQNQLYAIYLFFILFSSLSEQVMPMFVPQRALFEQRERPSKMYAWPALLLSNILVEMAWSGLAAAAVGFVCWYYPVGFADLGGGNVGGDDLSLRGLLVFLFIAMFLLFTSTFSHMAIAVADTAETAGVLTSLLYIFCISFAGVGVAPSDLPSFWTFMYRASPVTYMISGVMSSAMSGYEVACSAGETLHVQLPPNGNTTTCGAFFAAFQAEAGGTVLDPDATGSCAFCPLATTDDFLARFGIYYADRWRNFGLLWVYIVANIGFACALYWLFRVPRGKGVKRIV